MCQRALLPKSIIANSFVKEHYAKNCYYPGALFPKRVTDQEHYCPKSTIAQHQYCARVLLESAITTDKGELYIYFIPLYLVFCLVYHQFWAFYVCFYLLGDVRAKESKNEQLGVKRSNFGQNKRACRSMILSCRSMRHLSMSRHAQFMPRHGSHDVKNVIFYYFWKVGFRTPIVTLLPLLL